MELTIYLVGIFLVMGIDLVTSTDDDTWVNVFKHACIWVLSWLAVGMYLGLIYKELKGKGE